MAKKSFTSENKTRQFDGYPTLKLDHGEQARICIIEPEPTYLFVHTLKMPQIENGKIVKEVKKGKRGDYEVPAMDFVGQHICLGDLDTVEDKQLDPSRCVSCKMAYEHPDMFQPPAPRYAQHVIKYSTQPGKFSVRTPFQAELVAWVYPGGRFNTIVDFVEEHGSPREFDLLLGPCENKNFQKYDIKLGSKPAEWMRDPERQKLVAEIYKNNQCEDLEVLIGRKLSPVQMQMDIDKVLDKYAELEGGPSRPNRDRDVESSISTEDLLTGLPELAGEETAAAPVAAATATAVLEPEVEEEDTPDVPEPESAESESEEDEDAVVDFDELLKGL